MSEPTNQKGKLSVATAFWFVFILGAVNLFADTTYESGRSFRRLAFPK